MTQALKPSTSVSIRTSAWGKSNNAAISEGARKWLEWLFGTLIEVKFKPIIIMVEGNVFFEEFILVGTLPNGKVVESKQSEVLVYEDYKIKSLRVYFDRLDFADAVAEDFNSRRIVKTLISRSLKGLV